VRCLFAAALVAIATLAQTALAASQPIIVGSKNFTESIVLGEIVRLDAKRNDIAVEHRRALGGTRILWRALEEGSIDAYVEYTGTIVRELVHELPADADIVAIRAALAPHGIAVSDSLGFDDSYALGVRGELADRLSLRRISDLVAKPELRFGLSNEFMDRGDGWPGLRAAYALPQTNVRGMSHELAYPALASGAIDLVDLYTTDAEIPYYKLRVLEDDRHYFPAYQAVLLYRSDVAKRAAGFAKTVDALAGRIDVATMQRMNAAVKLDKRSERAVAAEFLGVPEDGRNDGIARRIAERTVEHLELVAISLGLALVVALPLGIFAARRPRLGQIVIATSGILQTIPSLAMFVFMIPLFGIGGAPAIAALFLYSLLPIVRNTHAGLTSIPLELRESAAALGLPPHVRLWRVELPLALRSILAGVKIAAVIDVGTATLGALIGAGGYGQPILTGIRLDDLALILEGAIPAALLALAVQGVFELIERALTPRGLRLVARQ